MTPLRYNVVRLIPQEYGRPLVVRLVPARGENPARIEFRELRTRTWFPLALGPLYVHAVRGHIDQERAKKVRKRRSR
jgi:hypothetical protein